MRFYRRSRLVSRINRAVKRSSALLERIANGGISDRVRADLPAFLRELSAIQADMWAAIAASDASPLRRCAEPFDALVIHWQNVGQELDIAPDEPQAQRSRPAPFLRRKMPPCRWQVI